MREAEFTFEKLIHPVSIETFVREHWEREPLVIERGRPEYYSSIFSIDEIDSIVGFRQLKYSQLKVAKTERESQANKVFYVDRDDTSDTNKLYNSYSQGDTLAFNFVQLYWESAAKLCWEFEHFFNFPVGINMYFTPRNSQGFAPHFDTHDVFVVQVEGSKVWRIYDSWEQLPSGIEDNNPLLPEVLGKPRREVHLRAGDLLYLPRGHVHEAQTTDASSIHFTIGVRPYKWMDLLCELLTVKGQENVNLREALPIGFLDSRDAVTMIKERVPELLGMVANGGHVEDAMCRLRERLIERMRPLPDGHFRSLDKVGQIGLETVVSRRKGMMCHVAKRDSFAEIAFPGNRMKGPANIESAFRFIADANKDFPVSALPSALSDESKVVLARRAVREGLLTIVGP